jgi:hypothetical protein
MVVLLNIHETSNTSATLWTTSAPIGFSKLDEITGKISLMPLISYMEFN